MEILTLCIPDVSVAIVSMRNKQLSLLFCYVLPLKREVTAFSISVFPLKGSTAVVNVKKFCTSNFIHTQQVDFFINFN